MDRNQPAWRSFEDVVRALIGRHKEFFGLESVDSGPGHATGKSGYTWNIEIIGYTKGHQRLTLFECRRKAKNLTPAEAGELAYRIEDLGADKGFFVTTLEKGLSEGAKTIADYEQIGHIQVSADATPGDYVLLYLNQIFAGVTTTVGISQRIGFEVRDKYGNLKTLGTGQ